MQAIETWYANCKFRSRLEARWGVVFDHLGIEWLYEPQGFLIGDMFNGPNKPYLPDFLLPKTKTWVEVKGDVSTVDWDLLANAIDWGGDLPDLPDVADSCGTARGLLMLGTIPDLSRTHQWMPCFPILQHSKGGFVNRAYFVRETIHTINDGDGDGYFDATQSNSPDDKFPKCVVDMINGAFGFDASTSDELVEINEVHTAFRAARSARFEHGQSGATP